MVKASTFDHTRVASVRILQSKCPSLYPLIIFRYSRGVSPVVARKKLVK